MSRLPENAKELATEDLAVCILQHVRERCKDAPSGFDFGNYARSLEQGDSELFLAVAEAWAWLIREGLVVPRSGEGWYVVSRRGRDINSRDRMEAFVRARLLPRTQLHPRIVEVASSAFTTGHYDTAVFAAFKEVEVAVRIAAGGTPQVGVALMRYAFGENGPLVDATEEKSEREALGHLFAGAIGRFRNAVGHRHVDLPAGEAVELIVFASHLLRVVDERTHVGREESRDGADDTR